MVSPFTSLHFSVLYIYYMPYRCYPFNLQDRHRVSLKAIIFLIFIISILLFLYLAGSPQDSGLTLHQIGPKVPFDSVFNKRISLRRASTSC